MKNAKYVFGAYFICLAGLLVFFFVMLFQFTSQFQTYIANAANVALLNRPDIYISSYTQVFTIQSVVVAAVNLLFFGALLAFVLIFKKRTDAKKLAVTTTLLIFDFVITFQYSLQFFRDFHSYFVNFPAATLNTYYFAFTVTLCFINLLPLLLQYHYSKKTFYRILTPPNK